MLSFLKLKLLGCNEKVAEIVKYLIVIIGFISIYLTFNIYNSKYLRFIFVILGTVGLISLLLFILCGTYQCLGFFGSIGIVLSFHGLLLPEIAIQLRRLNNYKPIVKKKIIKKNNK
jgi:hypothetical protein